MLSFVVDGGSKTANRKEIFTWIDFLANFGGLLGLFLGVSTLSIVELVYYSTLRLFWTIIKSKRKIIVVKPQNVE